MTKTDKPFKCLKYFSYGLCIICVVTLIVVLVLQSPRSSDRSNAQYFLYIYMHKETFATLLIAFGVIGIVIQFVAVYGIFKQNYWSLIGYSIVASILAGLCLGAAFVGQIGYSNQLTGSYAGAWFLTILLFASSGTASQLAKRLRKLAKSTSVVYVDPMTNENVIYPGVVPSGGGRSTTYLVSGGQQQPAPGSDSSTSNLSNQPMGSYGQPYQQQQRPSPTGDPYHQPFAGYPGYPTPPGFPAYGQHTGMLINPGSIGQQYGGPGPSSSASGYIGWHGYGYPPPHVMPNEAPPSYEPPGVSSPHYNTNPTNNSHNNTNDNTNRSEEVFVPPVVVVSSGKTMPPEPHWR
ncbi:uncharacterized protein LOC128956855 [Oppia nitens]|uniref:uncharacterized protein LOC128956855 n=1 Tax=Oppia nitens TaxID=1686743 RepID=UPI0023DAE5CA|nr:uncharacterized protein LOC128956855 [Oppia nitens]